MKQIRLEFILEARSPICHLEGSFGNIGVIMRKKVRQRNGTWAKVPILTGDTMRHQLREAGTYAVLDSAGMGEECLTEEAVRLLFAGGMVTGSSGPTVKLDEHRYMTEVFPPLGLLGGCVNNRIIPGKLKVSDAELICAETECFMPEWVREYVSTNLGGVYDGARSHVEEVQRVRMDPMLSPQKRVLLTAGDREKAEQKLLASEAAGEAGDVVAAEKTKCTMMPFSYETVCQGSLFFWTVTADLDTDLEEDTLLVMVGAFLRNARVGGKQGTGCGQVRPVAAMNVSLANFAERTDTLDMVGPDQRVGQVFRAHISDHAEKLRDFLAGVVA